MSLSVNQFVNLNDEQLYQMAEYQTALGLDKSKFTNNSLLFAIPVVDSFTHAAMTPGSTGAKAMTLTNRMVGWAGFFVIASLYNNSLDYIRKVCPSVKKFEKENPAISSALNIFGLWVAAAYAHKGVKALTKKITDKYPDKFKTLDTHRKDILNKIDNSWIDSKIYKPLSKRFADFSKKCPEMAKALKTASPWITPILVATAFSQSMTMLNDAANKTKDNFVRLKRTQDEIKAQMLH